MKELSIKAQKRENLGKGDANRLRKQGFVPGNLYGKGEQIFLKIKKEDLNPIIYTKNNYLINLEVDGKVYKCVKKEIQFHPVNDYPIHADFMIVNEEKPISVKLPIALVGNSVGVQAGGHLYQLKRYLTVKGLLKHIPEELVIDITNLELGKAIKVENLKFDNLQILDAPSDLVVMVKYTRAAKEAEQQQQQAGKK